MTQAENYLPNWSASRFVMLDRSRKWAVPVETQVAQNLRQSSSFGDRPPVLEACTTAKDVLLYCDQRSTRGLILMLSAAERECLTLLGRIARSAVRPPILAVGRQQQHSELLPVLLEAGVHCVLFDVLNDLPIADWCTRLLLQPSRASPLPRWPKGQPLTRWRG